MDDELTRVSYKRKGVVMIWHDCVSKKEEVPLFVMAKSPCAGISSKGNDAISMIFALPCLQGKTRLRLDLLQGESENVSASLILLR